MNPDIAFAILATFIPIVVLVSIHLRKPDSVNEKIDAAKARVDAACPKCGAAKRGDFCGKCGEPLKQPHPADWVAERSRRLQASADARGYPMSSPAPPPKKSEPVRYPQCITEIGRRGVGECVIE